MSRLKGNGAEEVWEGAGGREGLLAGSGGPPGPGKAWGRRGLWDSSLELLETAWAPASHLVWDFWQNSGEFSSRKVPGLHSHRVSAVAVQGVFSSSPEDKGSGLAMCVPRVTLNPSSPPKPPHAQDWEETCFQSHIRSKRWGKVGCNLRRPGGRGTPGSGLNTQSSGQGQRTSGPEGPGRLGPGWEEGRMGGRPSWAGNRVSASLTHSHPISSSPSTLTEGSGDHGSCT